VAHGLHAKMMTEGEPLEKKSFVTKRSKKGLEKFKKVMEKAEGEIEITTTTVI